MRTDRAKLPHNMTPEQRADLASDSERYSADAVGAATIAWLTGGWSALSSDEKRALASAELV